MQLTRSRLGDLVRVVFVFVVIVVVFAVGGASRAKVQESGELSGRRAAERRGAAASGTEAAPMLRWGSRCWTRHTGQVFAVVMSLLRQL